MKITAQVSISRRSDDKISIQIKDEASRSTFVILEFDPADFARALTGLSLECPCEVHGLEYVGKRRISEKRSVSYPGSTYGSKAEMKRWLEENCQEEGWLLDTYLGSQTSVGHAEGKAVLNYNVYKFVPAESD